MKFNVKHTRYIWQREDWPDFRWDAEKLMEPLGKLSLLLGRLNGKMSMLGFSKKSDTLLSALTEDLLGSSAIEGITLDPHSVRSSIARKLGIDDGGVFTDDRYIDGLVEVMLDATANCLEPLSAERLFGWHSALFPTGRSGMYKITVADWRKGEEPMRVVSGPLGREKVHYEAVPSAMVPDEMQRFIAWCNTAEEHPVIKSALAHLWLVTIHPFDDGNGRISRTVADMLLARLDEGDSKYFSVSAEINRNKRAYYEILEATQKGDLNVTDWLLWYIDCVEKAVSGALSIIDATMRKAIYWERFAEVAVNERQRKVINRLWDGFEGKMTTSKWAKICHCSQDTALRDITNLLSKKMLIVSSEGGRSTNYLLPYIN